MEKLLTVVADEVSQISEMIDENELCSLAKHLSHSKRVFCAGCGRSGLVMRAFAMRLMHLGIICYFVGEVTQPSIRKGDLLIIGSSSGETSIVRMMAKRSKDLGVDIALFTSHEDSSLSALADYTVLIPTDRIKSIQPGGNLFEQSMFLVCDTIAVMVKEILHVDESMMDANHTNLE